MYHIIFTSECTAERLSQSEIYHLLAKCRENNADSGVTSVLLHHNRTFLGYMEGPDDAVKDTFGKIQFDPRHYLCRVVVEGAIEQRRFPDKLMAFKNELDNTLFDPEKFNSQYLLSHPVDAETCFQKLQNAAAYEFDYKSQEMAGET